MNKDRTIWNRSVISEDQVIDVEVILWGGTNPGICLTNGEDCINLLAEEYKQLDPVITEAAEAIEEYRKLKCQ